MYKIHFVNPGTFRNDCIVIMTVTISDIKYIFNKPFTLNLILQRTKEKVRSSQEIQFST